MYLTYLEYINMGGELTEQDFNRYEYMSRVELDRVTMERVADMAEIPDAVKRVMYELVAVNASASAERTGQAVQSESVDKWSKSYLSKSAAEYGQTKYDLLRTYLSGVTDDLGTPLLYRGVG